MANAKLIAKNWAGPVQLRTLRKATHLGFTEGWHWSQFLLDGKAQRATQRKSRALLTAFFLVHLAGKDHYAPLLEDVVKGISIDHTKGDLATV